MAQTFDPAYWRGRAQESRRLAETLTDPVSRDVMANVAESYEFLARQADRRRGSEPEGAASGSGDIATPGN